jgi:DNA-binding NarL/FixJ family response regulator
MIRVIVADDHHLVRQGIRALLEQAGDIEVVGEAMDGQEALALVQQVASDVLVMDIAMPRLNGMQALAQMRALGLETQVIMLSMYSDDVFIRESLHNGARAYLLKGAVTEELLLAIRAAHQGATYLSPAISQVLLADPASASTSPRPSHPVTRLSPREHEVLQFIGKGQTNNAIAEQLQVSVKTVERHRANLMSKLCVRNLVELIRVAIKHGLIQLDD